jgi:hypothetical protein
MGVYGISLGMAVKKTTKSHKDAAMIDMFYMFSLCLTVKLFCTPLDFYLLTEGHRR